MRSTDAVPATQPAGQTPHRTRPRLRTVLPGAIFAVLVSTGVSFMMKQPAADRGALHQEATRVGRHIGVAANLTGIARACATAEAAEFDVPGGVPLVWRGEADLRWAEERALAYRAAAVGIARSGRAPRAMLAMVEQMYAPGGGFWLAVADQERVLQRWVQVDGSLPAVCAGTMEEVRAQAADMPIAPPAGQHAAR
jgi:hypothetical protein